ncbi:MULTISPECIES: hypothetical protein [unclassified Streptomyces]|uniref:hypothetical protein n=1 Tax=unclassified Streptomyces TaxID=2593676 RepID=UPI000DC410C2|nr:MULTISPECIES: hypothetical protein [unclassified Streptomyces]MYT71824.1 hypothetical protein [Streptomyces sp. SID8367]RAJ70641.1 hypothetical protein K377_07865 [Streptomyces sp. PsTaAH-137]
MELSVLAAAAATALVGAMATDTWTRATEAVTGLWRRFRPGEAEEIAQDLELLHRDVRRARDQGDEAAENQLVAEWQGTLGRVLRRHEEMAPALHAVLEEDLTPLLSEKQRQVVYKQFNTTSGKATSYNVQDGQIHIHQAQAEPKAPKE